MTGIASPLWQRVGFKPEYIFIDSLAPTPKPLPSPVWGSAQRVPFHYGQDSFAAAEVEAVACEGEDAPVPTIGTPAAHNRRLSAGTTLISSFLEGRSLLGFFSEVDMEVDAGGVFAGGVSAGDDSGVGGGPATRKRRLSGVSFCFGEEEDNNNNNNTNEAEDPEFAPPPAKKKKGPSAVPKNKTKSTAAAPASRKRGDVAGSRSRGSRAASRTTTNAPTTTADKENSDANGFNKRACCGRHRQAFQVLSPLPEEAAVANAVDDDENVYAGTYHKESNAGKPARFGNELDNSTSNQKKGVEKTKKKVLAVKPVPTKKQTTKRQGKKKVAPPAANKNTPPEMDITALHAPLPAPPAKKNITAIYNHYEASMPVELSSWVKTALSMKKAFQPAGRLYYTKEMAAMEGAAKHRAQLAAQQERLTWILELIESEGLNYGWKGGKEPTAGSAEFFRGIAVKYLRDRFKGRCRTEESKLKAIQ